MNLTEKEARILEAIRNNPFQSQQDIAQEVGMSRSAVANMISSLVQRNYLLGRAYIINEHESPVVCIGGMNVDRKFYALEKLMLKTSNPVVSSVSIGGVGRNVAENLGRLGESVVMLSRAGDDHDWELIKEASQNYMNLRNVECSQKEATSSYTAIIDGDGEMQIALANMAICDTMTIEWIQQYDLLLLRAKAIILDLNAPKDTIQYIIQLAKENRIPLAIIPVSSPKMSHLPGELDGVEWLIVNKDESETFFEVEAKTDEEFYNLATCWLSRGVRQVLITRGSESMVYMHQNGQTVIMSPKAVPHIVDTTGAGDSLSSGILFGWLNGFDIQKTLQFGLTNSYHTIASADTVRKTLSKQSFLQERNELYGR